MSNTMTNLLVVEDDEVDAKNVIRTVSKNNLPFRVDTVTDGKLALDFLRENISSDEFHKLVILLDINMPGMNGHEFLDEVRKDESLHRLIVFVLTTSNHERDKLRAYDKNVAGYFIKSDVDKLLSTISDYAQNVEFPPLCA